MHVQLLKYIFRCHTRYIELRSTMIAYSY